MSLPFLRKKHEAAVIVKQREPDIKPEEANEGEGAALESCANDMLVAIENKDHKALAAAMKAAFIVMESEPHEEASVEESEEE